MKSYVLSFLFVLASGFMFSQENNSEFVELDNGLVEATYYHDNGSIEQQGTFKDGLLHGAWTSFDRNGNKVAMGNYVKGKKTGKWFFWSDTSLKEVDYVDSRIVSVHEWKDKNKLAIRNR